MKDAAFEMLRIRMIEEEIARRYPEGKMRCPVHLSVGQEAAAVSICQALGPNDKMVSTHRAHAHYLAKGGSLKGLIGELYGKATGCSRGNGGSMHLIDLRVNFWGSTSIVGGTIPVGVGLAFADKLKGKNSTTVICMGDAAVEQGVFHEAANFVSLHNLDVIFFCENNRYSCYTHIKERRKPKEYYGGYFHQIAEAHGLNYLCVAPNTVAGFKKYGMPFFIEYPTYRHLEHCGPNNDDHVGYRDKTEVREWRAMDPVKVLDATWPQKIKAEIDEAFADAERAPWPERVKHYAD